jgi:hypothetical protein
MELEPWTPFSGTLLKTLFKTMVVTKEQRSNFSTTKNGRDISLTLCIPICTQKKFIQHPTKV